MATLNTKKLPETTENKVVFGSFWLSSHLT